MIFFPGEEISGIKSLSINTLFTPLLCPTWMLIVEEIYISFYLFILCRKKELDEKVKCIHPELIYWYVSLLLSRAVEKFSYSLICLLQVLTILHHYIRSYTNILLFLKWQTFKFFCFKAYRYYSKIPSTKIIFWKCEQNVCSCSTFIWN